VNQHEAPVTMLLVDDEPTFLEFARQRLSRGSRLQVVAEAPSGEAALSLVADLEARPDVVLLDVEMPGLDGFETARRLRTLAPTSRIILTSASSSPRYGTAAVRVGAVFLPKRSLSAEAILQLLD
jgi:DNA-binding NarL/FixJ family response regulator